MSQIKSLKFDVCIDYAHQLQLGSLMLDNHYASMYLHYSVMKIGLYLIVCYFGQKNVCCINAPVTLESNHNLKSGSDCAKFKIGTGCSDFDNRQSVFICEQDCKHVDGSDFV